MPVFAQYEMKDSYYFMEGDGIFSDEEKDEEAEFIKRQCDISVLEQKYYDCSCIAGAYRLKRNEKQLIPQSEILYNLYRDEETKCVDSAKIAGHVLEFCGKFTKYFRAREPQKRNTKYCECVANKVARDFKKKPRLSSRYIQYLKTSAMSSCDKRSIN